MKRIIVQSILKDVRNSGSIPQKRSEMIETAPNTPLREVYPANELADKLHAKNFALTVTSCCEEDDVIITTLEPENEMTLYFREGQQLALKFAESKNSFSVPVMSVSGKKKLIACVTKLSPAYDLFKNSDGKKLMGISFEGNFFYNSLRDGDKICVLTDINGVASVHSIVSAASKASFYVYFFGGDINNFRNLALIPSSELPDFEKLGRCSVYVCGSHEFCEKIQAEIKSSGYSPISLRILDLGVQEETPSQITHKCTVLCKGKTYEFECREGEKLLYALENADIPVNGKCANGECGYCRSRLLSGEIRFLAHKADRRTAADVIYGYIHPCCVTPESDITIEI